MTGNQTILRFLTIRGVRALRSDLSSGLDETGDAWAAEDLAQETFVVAIDKWDRFDNRSARSTWLYGILVQLRRRRWTDAGQIATKNRQLCPSKPPIERVR